FQRGRGPNRGIGGSANRIFSTEPKLKLYLTSTRTHQGREIISQCGVAGNRTGNGQHQDEEASRSYQLSYWLSSRPKLLSSYHVIYPVTSNFMRYFKGIKVLLVLI